MTNGDWVVIEHDAWGADAPERQRAIRMLAIAQVAFVVGTFATMIVATVIVLISAIGAWAEVGDGYEFRPVMFGLSVGLFLTLATWWAAQLAHQHVLRRARRDALCDGRDEVVYGLPGLLSNLATAAALAQLVATWLL
ncbi:hypothetical protein [Cellulomonas sp. ES6]|uniref:hypothetical protein n=1 Tax=Cellulomonas sp. ES6 TaxID=3039384 RepID=UPI0024B750FF|nr:hypothetical protein [Cellulomonas sp. ES6]WHP16580.1 hypothetical protein P9841_13275 [Cellulomonas sp. ES6]